MFLITYKKKRAFCFRDTMRSDIDDETTYGDVENNMCYLQTGTIFNDCRVNA